MKELLQINIKTEDVLLMFGVLFLVMHYYIFPIDPKTQMIVLLSLVFLVGVPHGALDFLVDDKISVELKAIIKLEEAHYAQAMNYLEAYNL